ncbi:MAG: nucleoside-diphosphate-sugar epimerase [Alphaproteobacteria bacterium]|jgi:nucleoside-diphosphate-sugar epimerase
MKQGKKQNILLVGATGFTGQRVLKFLCARDDTQVTCMLRKNSIPPEIEKGHYIVVRANLDDADSLKKALSGKDGMIYVASLGFGHAPSIVKACEDADIKKCVFTSTTAILTKLNASSKKVRLAAERSISTSKLLNWTIIRPTMIYGLKGDRNMERLVQYIKRWPVLFVPGSADALQQPNHVYDVANAIISAYFSKNTKNKTYNISGDKAISFRKIIKIITEVSTSKIKIIPLPLTPILWLLKPYELIASKPHIKAEQLRRLNENKNFSHAQAEKDFDFKPKSFKKGIEELIKSLED